MSVRRPRPSAPRSPLGVLLAALGASVAAAFASALPLHGQVAPTLAPAPPPFAVGERLEYAVSVARLGEVGAGAMWVDGLAEVRGRPAMLLRFELAAGKGPIKGSDRTRSWLDATRMAALRFEKEEQHPLSRYAEAVEVFPEDRRWARVAGKEVGAGRASEGTSVTDRPLDELSFIYFLRTLPLDQEGPVRYDRHFDPAHNPTTVAVVGRRTLATKAGEFQTIQLEMRVRDPRRYKGDGVIRIDLSDDARRVPVRIESAMPVFGRTVLTLTAVRGLAVAAR